MIVETLRIVETWRAMHTQSLRASGLLPICRRQGAHCRPCRSTSRRDFARRPSVKSGL
jgi:hypothetical protein